MKKIVLFLLALSLFLGAGAAAAEGSMVLGEPFPDFSVRDTEGKTFTLSKALEKYEAVVINIWATWCPPCEMEFPHLNEVYKEYKGRVAFIALSCDPGDTLRKIELYRRLHGISFPMGQDQNYQLAMFINGGMAIPATVVVDRFGCAGFTQTGMFTDASQVSRVLDCFLGDGYTVPAVLDAVPADVPEGSARSYTIRVSGPDGDPVPGVSVSFCTDESCVMCESDENGIISFRGAPDNYHVQLVDVPDGWIADGSSDFYTGYALTQWVLKLGREGGSR